LNVTSVYHRSINFSGLETQARTARLGLPECASLNTAPSGSEIPPIIFYRGVAPALLKVGSALIR
jgi:hypothetical protein